MSQPDFHYMKRYPQRLSGRELDSLLSAGWFRSRQSMHTCSHIIDESGDRLKKVFWIRYESPCLSEHGSHHRIRRKNRSFHVEYMSFDEASHAEQSLYSRYRSACGFVTNPRIVSLMSSPCLPSVFNTMSIRIHDGSRLIAMGLFDHGDDSVASILHFYDPIYSRHSLGKHLILLTLDWMRMAGLRFYYPGYVVAGNPRLDYKLFLGRDQARYLDQVKNAWMPFRDDLLISEEYSEEDMELFLSRMGIADEFAVLGLV